MPMHARMKSWGATEFEGKIVRWYPGAILPFEVVKHLSPTLYELIIDDAGAESEPDPGARGKQRPARQKRYPNTMVKPEDLETS